MSQGAWGNQMRCSGNQFNQSNRETFWRLKRTVPHYICWLEHNLTFGTKNASNLLLGTRVEGQFTFINLSHDSHVMFTIYPSSRPPIPHSFLSCTGRMWVSTRSRRTIPSERNEEFRDPEAETKRFCLCSMETDPKNLKILPIESWLFNRNP